MPLPISIDHGTDSALPTSSRNQPHSSNAQRSAPSVIQTASDSIRGLLLSLYKDVQGILRSTLNFYHGQPLYRKVLLILLVIFEVLLDVYIMLNYNYIITKMTELSDEWYRWGFKGIFFLSALIFLVSFPPMIGFTFLCTLTGMIYGLAGWPILAFASITGSTCSFILFKYFLLGFSKKMINSSDKFKLFASVLNDETASFKQNLLIMSLIRMSPLPYALSNGALSAIPGLRTVVFSSASIVTSPKFLIHLYIGSQLKKVGKETDGAKRAIDLLSVLITGVSFLVVTYIIYTRFKTKLQERESELNGDNIDLGLGYSNDNILTPNEGRNGERDNLLINDSDIGYDDLEIDFEIQDDDDYDRFVEGDDSYDDGAPSLKDSGKV